ncbi:hypothetical protein GCM10023229_15080 [Flavisolibacter ginsenosidimutans]
MKNPSAIGIVPLLQYSAQNVSVKADTTYQVIQDATTFHASFAASSTARKPNFDGQMVVTILTKQLPSQAFRFTRAEVAGKTVNVYAQSCQRDADSTCEKSSVVMAAIPKVGSARSVQFFVNNQPKELVSW